MRHGIELIDQDKCDEAEAAAMISRFNAESRGFYDAHSFVNYDKAMKMLGVKNRNAFKTLCDTNHIEQKKMNNMPVGFLRCEIEDLATRLRNETGHD